MTEMLFFIFLTERIGSLSILCTEKDLAAKVFIEQIEEQARLIQSLQKNMGIEGEAIPAGKLYVVRDTGTLEYLYGSAR